MLKYDTSFCIRAECLTPDELSAALEALDTSARLSPCPPAGHGVAPSENDDTELSAIDLTSARAGRVQIAYCSNGENSQHVVAPQGLGAKSGALCPVATTQGTRGLLSASDKSPWPRPLSLGERFRAVRKATKSQPLPDKGWRKTTTAEKVVIAMEASSERSGCAYLHPFKRPAATPWSLSPRRVLCAAGRFPGRKVGCNK